MLYLTVTVPVNLTIGLSGPRAAAIVNVALPCFKALNPGIFPEISDILTVYGCDTDMIIQFKY